MASQIYKVIDRYGIRWRQQNDLSIELKMIAHGGYVVQGGKQLGLGLFEHFMRARELIWPDRYRHRWTDLIYKEILGNIVTILMGCASSGKTSTASEFILIDYWAHPNDTIVLVSSTSLEKLDLAVFGEITMLHKQGQSRHPFLAGNRLQSRKAITTDLLEVDNVRDVRKGIIARPCYIGREYVGLGAFAGIKQKRIRFLADELALMECFPGDALVDTELGPRRIDSIRPGDKVWSAAGLRPVRATGSRLSTQLVRVDTWDGRKIVCTPNHPFFTNRGWVKACQLNKQHYLISTNEALSLLPHAIQPEAIPTGMRSVFGKKEQNLQTVRESVPGSDPVGDRSRFLRSHLQREMADEPTGRAEQSLYATTLRKDQPIQETVERHSRRTIVPATSVSAHEGESTNAQPGDLPQGGRGTSRFGLQTSNSRRERNWSDKGRGAITEDVPGSNLQLCRSNRPETRERVSPALQGRRWISSDTIGHRSGWFIAQQSHPQASGQKEGGPSAGAWVDRVTVLEQGNYRFQNSCEHPGRCRVYNLQVEGHPSYAVAGLLVHNCTFFDCLPNMFQSADIDSSGEPQVKVIGSGNPKNDPFDMLSISAEPKDGGWDLYRDISKTTCWDTKFHKGRCVNLIGTDSPNFDPPATIVPRYQRLISPNSVRLVEQRWGRDSLKYVNQCVGRMVMGMLGNRVISKQLCEDHHAFERAVWQNDEFTRIGFLDPAWGGANADRCIWGWLRMGYAMDGVQLVELMSIEEIPIQAGRDNKEADDQIAEHCRRSALANGVPPDNIFYDSTGRGIIGAAFARVFGLTVPVPIAFGDRPSERPVRHDLFVQERGGSKRLKRCDEEYGKRVTELWFAVRNVIECNQFRGLTEGLCKEGCSREYQLLLGSKIDVEPKDDMRERTGRSPDLFDALACGIEGCRQRGLKIQRVGYEMIETQEIKEDFFETETNQYAEMISDQLLEHNV